MKQTELIMGMPVTIEIPAVKTREPFCDVFDYFHQVDERFSTYKSASEISQINAGLESEHWSSEMLEVMKMCEETKRLTNGYFDIDKQGYRDPSGLVKGWAINNAADLLKNQGWINFYIEAGGDIAVCGHNAAGEPWSVGIRNPFDISEIVKEIRVADCGVATSGTYIRGEHIYDPRHNYRKPQAIKSLTVIGPNIFEADRFATAAFAMGQKGIIFIETLPGFEAYMIDENKIATFTRGFEQYVA